MKITKGQLRQIIQEEFTRVLSEQDSKDIRDAEAAADRAKITVKDMWGFVTREAGGPEKAIELITTATKGVSSNIGQAILKMFKEGEGQIQEGLVDFFTGSTINTLKEMGKKLVRDLGTMANAEGNRGDGRHNARMETALNDVLKQSGIPANAQSAIRMLIASVGTI
jgi:hypothetical protein